MGKWDMLEKKKGGEQGGESKGPLSRTVGKRQPQKNAQKMPECWDKGTFLP